MFGNLLSPDIPLCVKVEEGGKLGILNFFFWKRATSIQGFLIPADKDATVESLTGRFFSPTCWLGSVI